MPYFDTISREVIERIKQVFSLFKVIDFLIIEQGGINIYGLNYEHSILKYTSIEPIPNIPPILYIASSTVSTDNMKDPSTQFILFNKSIIISNNELQEFNYLFCHRQLFTGYTDARALMKEIEVCNITGHIEHIQQEPSFAIEILSMRAADGVQYYKYNGYMMSLYVGILPITKTDVQLDIFDKSKLACFIGRFTIKKKTGQILKVYLRFLKVTQ